MTRTGDGGASRAKPGHLGGVGGGLGAIRRGIG